MKSFQARTNTLAVRRDWIADNARAIFAAVAFVVSATICGALMAAASEAVRQMPQILQQADHLRGF
ncbi:MAG: hypothetical protein V4747_11345 [Pseudomonadota bacterium]